MDIAWDDLKFFLAIAETGSLSKAARQLRVGQPTVTRRSSISSARGCSAARSRARR